MRLSQRSVFRKSKDCFIYVTFVQSVVQFQQRSCNVFSMLRDRFWLRYKPSNFCCKDFKNNCHKRLSGASIYLPFSWRRQIFLHTCFPSPISFFLFPSPSPFPPFSFLFLRPLPYLLQLEVWGALKP